MEFLSLISNQPEQTAVVLSSENERLWEKYGLALTDEQVKDLAETYTAALKDNEIVEIGAGGVTKIMDEFAQSDYADSGNFAELVNTMTDAFYYLKREACREVNDTRVIHAMRDLYDHHSMGSLDLFLSRELEILIRYINENKTDENGVPDYTLTNEDNYDTEPEYEPDL